MKILNFNGPNVGTNHSEMRFTGVSSPLNVALRFFPLDREEIFFLMIARFTGGDQVSLGAGAPSNNRNQVIHRQFGRLKSVLAVMTNSPASLSLPPCSCAKGAGLRPFDT